jgi:hypothetical protein
MERFILHWQTDLLAGTMVIGSIMSIFLVCTIVILTAFYFYGRISLKNFLVLIFFLFLPTTLNESKATIVLLVLGLLVVMSSNQLKGAHIAFGISAISIMLLMFVAIYSIEFGSHGATSGRGLYSFFADPDTGIKWYLYSGDSEKIDADNLLQPNSNIIGAMSSLEEEKFDDNEYRGRRLDALILPIRTLSKDPLKLLMGLGIGNTSTSISDKFSGKYSFIGGSNVAKAALSPLLWEIGVMGVLLYLIFFYFIYKDARYLSQKKDFMGAFALGWSGVVVILIITLPYKNVFLFENLCALFWYFSGHIAAQRFRYEKENPSSISL